MLQDQRGLSCRIAVTGNQAQLRCRRRLVRVVDAGHAGEQAGPGPGVEALGVAPFALLQRRVDEDLEEGDAGLFVGGMLPFLFCAMAMSAVGVNDLVEPLAQVEIEATAVLA